MTSTNTEPNYTADRMLQDGLSCADCKHGARCDALFGAVSKQFTSCDFWPSRFVRAALSDRAGEG